MSIAAILGSAFAHRPPESWSLEEVEIETRRGEATLYRLDHLDREAYALFRHGRPHRWLPNQIPYRRHALALDRVGCEALLVTSSVGVLRPELPLFQPLPVEDLLTLDNRLPDGSACTVYDRPHADQGHLVLDDGLFDPEIGEQLRRLADRRDVGLGAPVVFGYVGGPRGKTRAENRMWRSLGADVNSMTLAPEVVLANELEIPCAGVVVGHKYSLPERTEMADAAEVEGSLEQSRESLEELTDAFLTGVEPGGFGNQIYRFSRLE
ncbi:MAG: 5'-methylthioadenosine phosphorylase [Bradymonadaceae bacterium]